MSTTTRTPAKRPANLRLSGAEAQYAMRYLRRLADRRDSYPPAALVGGTGRRDRIEAFVDELVGAIVQARS